MLFRLKTLLLSQSHIRFSSWNPSSPVQERKRPKFVLPLPLPLFDSSKPFIICVAHRTIKASWLEPVNRVAGLHMVLEWLNHPFSHAITSYVIRSNMNVFDAIEFHKMRKFLASKLRTIVQCTGNPYLENSSHRGWHISRKKRSQNCLAFAFESTSTWKLKSPQRRNWQNVTVNSSDNAENSEKNLSTVKPFFLDGGGRYTVTRRKTLNQRL